MTYALAATPSDAWEDFRLLDIESQETVLDALEEVLSAAGSPPLVDVEIGSRWITVPGGKSSVRLRFTLDHDRHEVTVLGYTKFNLG